MNSNYPIQQNAEKQHNALGKYGGGNRNVGQIGRNVCPTYGEDGGKTHSQQENRLQQAKRKLLDFYNKKE